MRVEIINTGSELLLGQVINTHLAFLAESLFPLGLSIARQTTVPDGEAIRDSLLESFQRADIVIATGGLGPTTDDLTRNITAELLGLALVKDPVIEAAITERLARRGITLTERVLLQALRPAESEVLPNPFGTAPGLYFKPQPLPATGRLSPHLFLLPGPPRELRPMVESELIPRLRSILPPRPEVCMETWRVAGVPESLVEEAVGRSLIEIGIEPGYCARLGEVNVRVIGSRQQIQSAERILKDALGDAVLPPEALEVEPWIVNELTKRRLTVAIAESCTGGYISNRITNAPGSSAVFGYGFVTYANSAKEMMGVPGPLIAAHGAVSEEVAREMARAVRQRAGADIGLATTGIAGPGGGSEAKPVGTVFIAIALPNGDCTVEKRLFSTDRLSFKELTARAALDMLRRSILSLK